MVQIIDLRTKKDIEKETKKTGTYVGGILALITIAGMASFIYGIYILIANFFSNGGTSVINDGLAVTVGADKIASRPAWWPFVVIGIIIMIFGIPYFSKQADKETNQTKEMIIKDFLAQPAIATSDINYTAIEGLKLKTQKSELQIDLLMISPYSVSIVNFRDMDKKLYKGTLNMAEISLESHKMPFPDCPTSFNSYENNNLDFFHQYDRVEYKELAWQLRFLMNILDKEKKIPAVIGNGSLKGFVITPYTKKDAGFSKDLGNAIEVEKDPEAEAFEREYFSQEKNETTGDDLLSSYDMMIQVQEGYYEGKYGGVLKTNKSLTELTEEFAVSHKEANTTAYVAWTIHKNNEAYPTLEQAAIDLFGAHSSTQNSKKKQETQHSTVSESAPQPQVESESPKSKMDDLFD